MNAKRGSRKARTFALGMAGLMLFGVMLTLAPDASAQQGQAKFNLAIEGKQSIFIDRFGTGPEVKAVISVQYYYENPALTESMLATLTVSNVPSWLSVSPMSYTDMVGGTSQLKVPIVIKAPTDDVKAGTVASIQLKVSGKPQFTGGGVSSVEDSSAMDIVVTFNPFTDVQLSMGKPIQQTSPDNSISYPVTITNLGNAKTKVQLDLSEKATGWRYVFSKTETSLLPREPGTTAYPTETVILTLQSPKGGAISYKNEWEDGTITAKAYSEVLYTLPDGSPLTTQTQSLNYDAATTLFLCKNKGMYIPGFDAIIIIGALAFVFLHSSTKRTRK